MLSIEPTGAILGATVHGINVKQAGEKEFARILRHFPLPRQETVVVSKRCDVASDRTRGILSPVKGTHVVGELLSGSLLLWHRDLRVKPF